MPGNFYPSISFGLDTAAVNLMNQRLRGAFPVHDHSPTPRQIPVNALLETSENSPRAIEQELEKLINHGFKTIKIKIARTAPSEDSQRINRVLGMLPDGISLRLDANRKWTFDQAMTFAKSIETGKQFIEYIEEPFDWKTTGQLEQFHRDTGLPIALDESLASGGVDLTAIEPGKGISALILKPTLLGGIERITSIIAQAKQNGLAAIISSCFETGPGFIELCKMAATLEAGPGAFGLDTLKYLGRTLFQHPITIENGCISLDVQHMAHYNFEQLETIYP
jgi:O-succinylbenzoate synthase